MDICTKTKTYLFEFIPFFGLINQFFGIIWVHKSQIVPGQDKRNVTHVQKQKYNFFNCIQCIKLLNQVYYKLCHKNTAWCSLINL